MVAVGRRGMTLIEITVALAIVAIVTAAVIVSLSNVRQAQLSEAAGTMSGMMRYLYNLAVVNHRPYRMVIDMDERKYWGEALQSEDPCALYEAQKEPGEREDAGAAEERRRQAKSDREDRKAGRERRGGPRGGASSGRAVGAQAAGGPGDPRGGVMGMFPGVQDVLGGTPGLGGGQGPGASGGQGLGGGGGAFLQAKDNLLAPRKLPGLIGVTGVLTTHDEETQEEGRAAIYFYPAGYAERAFVWLGGKDPDDPQAFKPELTLELLGMMGQVRRHAEVLTEADFNRERSL